MFKNSTVLVTGATGMIGVQLVKLLAGAGAREIRTVSLESPTMFAGVEPVRHRVVDLRSRQACIGIIDGVDYVFHLAGIKAGTGLATKRAASFFVPLLQMNTNVLQMAFEADVKRVLYTSSIGVYGTAETLYEDAMWTTSPSKNDWYPGWAKRMGELQAMAYKEEYGWDRTVIVRPTNVYGPYDNFNPETAMVVPSLIHRLVECEREFTVWGDGRAVRDFIFSRDVARGMIHMMEYAPGCTPVNLGGGKTSIRDLVETLIEVSGKRVNVVWEKDKPTGDSVRVLSQQRAMDLGFIPQTLLPDGLRETYEWYLTNKNKVSGRFDPFATETL